MQQWLYPPSVSEKKILVMDIMQSHLCSKSSRLVTEDGALLVGKWCEVPLLAGRIAGRTGEQEAPGAAG